MRLRNPRPWLSPALTKGVQQLPHPVGTLQQGLDEHPVPLQQARSLLMEQGEPAEVFGGMHHRLPGKQRLVAFRHVPVMLHDHASGQALLRHRIALLQLLFQPEGVRMFLQGPYQMLGAVPLLPRLHQVRFTIALALADGADQPVWLGEDLGLWGHSA